MADLPDPSPSTDIAGRLVPIGRGIPSVVRFAGGRLGEREAGVWQFWTAVDDLERRITTRCREGRDPGERFRATETRPQEHDSWLVVSRAKVIRPATMQEVNGWLQAHPADAPYAESGRIGDKSVRVDRTNDGCRLR
jgi:hypothetical protein